MDDILEIYRQVIKGSNNQDVYTYNNLNIHFSGGLLNTYDNHGRMPNRYPLPSDEEEFTLLLDGIDKKYEKLDEEQQYICFKCHKTFDLPPAKTNNAGFMGCHFCADGGDVRGDRSPKDKESDIPSTVPTIELDQAITLLRKSGYVVKKLSKNFKVAYRDTEGEEKISAGFFRSEKHFLKAYPTFKFIGLIKQLSESEEIDID